MNVSSSDALERLNSLTAALDVLADGYPSAVTLLLADLLDLSGGELAMLLRGTKADAVVEFSTNRDVVGRHFNLSEREPLKALGYSAAITERLSKPNNAWTLMIAAKKNAAAFGSIPESALSVVGTMLTAMHRAEERDAIDALTLLPARSATISRLREVTASAERRGILAALLFIDIDKFKTVNDTFGHARGDELLRTLAQRMRQTLRADEFIGRIGGDEFAVVLPFLRDVEEAKHTAQRLCDVVAEMQQDVSLSIGIAFIPDHGENIEDLLARADAAMYAAKRADLCYSVSGAEGEGAETAASIGEMDVEHEFLLCFQPIFDSVSGRIARAEALPRWLHPRRGVLAPVDFLRLSTQRTTAIDTWALEQALARAPGWRTAHNLEQIHVNVRVRDDRDLEALAQILKDASPEARSCIALEVQYVAGGQLTDAVNLLAASGVQVGLDGFQAIRLNLLELSLFNLSFVKIAATALPAAEYQRVIKAVVGLAKIFHWNVIVTQIERPADTALEDHPGVRYLQGFRFAQPLTAADFEQWLRAGERRGSAITM
jgi:diguanylate cyclase (GGDEF)-like protein